MLRENYVGEYEGRLRERLSCAKHPLVMGVGGGNDTVSVLMPLRQLKQDFGFEPESVSIMGILPDCLDYHHTEGTSHPLIHRITPHTQRSVQGKRMTQLPEAVLAQHKEACGIDAVFGVSMRAGSRGMSEALTQFVADNRYDLVLAFDVGGDFLAVPENHHVLSPMMDGYGLVALREVQKRGGVPLVCGVFGLGTDGETPPHLLEAALAQLPEVYEGSFDPQLIEPVDHFHREYVEPVRYSRTADFTLREILGQDHPNPAEYRARFHTKPVKEAKTNVYYGSFMHTFDPKYFGKYYLFDDVRTIQNPYAIECSNGLEWFLNVQRESIRVNHELNGQAYMDMEQVLCDERVKGKSIFFGTPSHKFSPDTQDHILCDVIASIRNGVFDHALLFTTDVCGHAGGLHIEPITAELSLVSAHVSGTATAIRSTGINEKRGNHVILSLSKDDVVAFQCDGSTSSP